MKTFYKTIAKYHKNIDINTVYQSHSDISNLTCTYLYVFLALHNLIASLCTTTQDTEYCNH